jgi:alpha-D-ribose 1-methylphosphonate 5-triphosphate synthase subunit PhnG
MSLPTLWLRALHARPAQQLHTLVEQLGTQAGWQVRPKALPQSGLGMLQLTDSALQDNFNLGEIPLSTAWVEIALADGSSVEGAAQLMDESHQQAGNLAVCDAVLRHRLPGCELIEQEIAMGMEELAQRRRERQSMLARTRVDFSLLDRIDDDDE